MFTVCIRALNDRLSSRACRAHDGHPALSLSRCDRHNNLDEAIECHRNWPNDYCHLPVIVLSPCASIKQSKSNLAKTSLAGYHTLAVLLSILTFTPSIGMARLLERLQRNNLRGSAHLQVMISRWRNRSCRLKSSSFAR